MVRIAFANLALLYSERTYRFKRNPGRRESIFLATKFGITMQGTRGDPEYVKEQCYTSLKRLGVDYIDLYYQHRWVIS